MSVLAARAVELPSGETVPALGQGTWHLAEGLHSREEEIAALRLGLDLGMTLIDTADAYAGGATEELVGEAVEGRREDVFLVSKVRPDHATRGGTIAACRDSLRRLRTDRLDLYVLHSRGRWPLEQTIRGFEDLRSTGLIRHWGVSAFDLPQMAELARTRGGEAVQTDQVPYSLMRRGIEWNLLPWCQRAGVPVMASSPIEQGRLVGHPVLRGIAVRRHATSAQVALAWVLAHQGVAALPRAGTTAHVRENREALDLHLKEDDLLELDAAFPPPTRPQPLQPL